MAESTIGLFKTELYRDTVALAAKGDPWRALTTLEIRRGVVRCGCRLWRIP